MKASNLVRVVLLLAVSLLLAGTARAQGRFGFGVIFGDPTGLAWNYRLDHEHSVDGALGFTPFDRFRMHVDYLWRSYPFEERHLSLHYGLGGAVAFGRSGFFIVEHGEDVLVTNENTGFGARAVVGLTYDIPRSPVDLFVEVAPIFVLAPGAGIDLEAGIGARIYP